MGIYAEAAALLLIDMQKESRYGIEGVDEVVGTAERVVAACRSAGLVVAYTRHVNRPDGIGVSTGEVFDADGRPVYYRAGTEAVTIHDAIEPEPHDVVIDKHRWSGFHGTSLDLVLRSLGVRQLFIGGFTTDCCVLTSVFDAYARDYRVSLVPDMCAATNLGSHQAAVLMMANWVYGIEILSADDVIKKVAGEPNRSWRATAPDMKQFRAETMQDAYESLFRDGSPGRTGQSTRR
jgi:biuret amidohydrolase